MTQKTMNSKMMNNVLMNSKLSKFGKWPEITSCDVGSDRRNLYLLLALRSLSKLDYFLTWNFGMMKTWILLREMLE